MPHYDVTVRLSGEDGNAFAILARVDRALKNAGVSDADREQFYEEATAEYYDHLLRTCAKWVNVT